MNIEKYRKAILRRVRAQFFKVARECAASQKMLVESISAFEQKPESNQVLADSLTVFASDWLATSDDANRKLICQLAVSSILQELSLQHLDVVVAQFLSGVMQVRVDVSRVETEFAGMRVLLRELAERYLCTPDHGSQLDLQDEAVRLVHGVAKECAKLKIKVYPDE